MHNGCGIQIGALQSDNGGEYLSKEFRAYLKSKGTHHELTVPHSPEQNAWSSRKDE